MYLKVYNVKQGDTVKILPGEKVVELLQRGHGGWEDAMKKVYHEIFLTISEFIYMYVFP